MRNSKFWFVRALGVLACILAGWAGAADGVPAPDTVSTWLQMRAHLFGDRPISTDSANVVQLIVPDRAQDAATVPVSISTRLDQSATRYVRKLYLFIDANPSPMGGTFTFTPLSGRADIETRVRVEDYTWMRVVAEMNDGALYIDQHYVKAAGGCSAPAGGAGANQESFIPRAKLEVDESVLANMPVLARLMIQHPNSSGLAKDQLTLLDIPPYFVRRIEVSYADRPVMTADVDFTISTNPNFRFYFTPDRAADLKVVIVDTKDKRVESSVRVTPNE